MQELGDLSTFQHEENPGFAVQVDGPETDEHQLSRRDHQVLSHAWERLLRRGLHHRKKFDDVNREAKRFCYESHDHIFRGTAEDAKFKSTVPLVWELVSIFSPMISFKEPNRTVRLPEFIPEGHPWGQPLPTYEAMLNKSARTLDLRQESREWTDQGIVAGCSVMWLHKDPQTGLYGHYHDDVSNFVVDPDAKVFRDCYWQARRHLMPRWKFAQLVGKSVLDPNLPRGSHPVVAGYELDDVTEQDRFSDQEILRGKTAEQLEVWEIWTKLGIGWRLKDIPWDHLSMSGAREPVGDYAHFYIVGGSGRLWHVEDWPVPLWATPSGWPANLMYFRKKADYIWPVSLIKPLLGQQKTIDWLHMMLMNKFKTSHRDLIAMSKVVDERFREELKHGMDMAVIDIDPIHLQDNRTVADLVKVLQFPEANKDSWAILDLFRENFQRGSGLTNAITGMQRGPQQRSATGADLEHSRADIRPEDMRNVVEACHGRLGRAELLAMRRDYEQRDVARYVGPELAQAWGEYERGDLWRLAIQLEFTIEAGSGGRPNKQTEQAQISEVYDRMMQIAGQYGDLEATNKLNDLLQRAHQVRKSDRVYIKPPPPPPEAQEPRQPDTAESEEAVAAAKAQGEQAKAAAAGSKAEEAELDKIKKELALTFEYRGKLPPAPSQAGEPVAVKDGQPVYR